MLSYLGQNKDNLINCIHNDYGYSKESAIEAVEKAAAENMVKIVFFNGKDSYRIVDKDDNTILCPIHSKTNQNRLKPCLSRMS